MEIYAVRGITHGWGRLITVMGPAGDAAVRAAIGAHEEALGDITVVATAGNPTQYHAKRQGALERLIEAAGITLLTRDQWDAHKAAIGPPHLLRISFAVAPDTAPLFEAALAAVSLSIALVEEGGQWRLEALVAADADLADLHARVLIAAAAKAVDAPEWVIEPVPETDWIAAVQADSPAIRAGRYHVHGSHLPPDRGCGVVDIEIDAGLAFGTGDHESTRGCLLALDGLADRLRVGRALDMGCGSGLLAIAMAKTWGAAVIASDIDPLAATTARDNARRNRVGELIETVDGDGYDGAAIKRGAPYDLITANILAGPLILMAPDLAGHLAPHGMAVLAGLLARQEDAVVAAHRAAGLALMRSIPLGDWRALVLTRA